VSFFARDDDAFTPPTMMLTEVSAKWRKEWSELLTVAEEDDFSSASLASVLTSARAFLSPSLTSNNPTVRVA